jgi:hypothetical protein
VEDKMSTQEQQFFGTREFRIAVIAVAAVFVLAAAAYLFGTGLRADTSASVAPSPLGSSLTNVRESLSEDYIDRLNNAAAAARAASLAALAKSRSDFYAGLSASAASSASAGLSAAEYAATHDIPAASVARPESLETLSERWANFYAELDKAMTAAGARPSQGSSIGRVESSAADQFQWIKPEGITPR